jgi:putative ATPase
MGLFDKKEEEKIFANAPLAVRMRPRTLGEFAGQSHFVGEGKLLRRMLDADRLTSVIFYGPPGVGKTSLARVIANTIIADFRYLNATGAGVKDIREVTQTARDRLVVSGSKTILFLDEIHRFNRSQQDSLLSDVEHGIIILIGATTENPYFSINGPLISRSTVFEFKPLEKEDIVWLLEQALSDRERGFGQMNIDADREALEFIADICDGDGRRSLNALEITVLSQAKNSDSQAVKIDIEAAKESVQKKGIKYDSTGDNHYDIASALQKSIRGSDPDAAVYWLGRMIAGGENVRFIARRLAVCAAEDVGNADPFATVLAASVCQIADFIGLPEAKIPLSQLATYLACAPKSNAACAAIDKAMGDIENGRVLEVPPHLRDAHYKSAAKLGRGVGYKYPHNYPGGYVAQDYLGAGSELRYYEPKDIGREKKVKEHLERLREYKAMNLTNQDSEDGV